MKKILIFLTTALVSVVGMIATTKTASAAELENNQDIYITLSKGNIEVYIDGELYYDDEEKYSYYDWINGYGLSGGADNSSTGESGIGYYNVNVNGVFHQHIWLQGGSLQIDDNNLIYETKTNGQLTSGNLIEFLTTNNGIRIEEGQEPTRPGISGKDSIINNIDSPYSLDDIKRIANITAKDDYYGDISNAIKVKTDNYTANKNKVGIFKITYEVTNDFGLSAEYILNVINQDITAPVVTGPASATQSYTKAFNPADIVNQFTVTDNHDTGLTAKLDSHDYVANKVGTFTFNLSATDASGNKGFAIYKLNVIDDVAPEIKSSNSGTIQLNWKDTFTDSKLLLGLTATDAIDGTLTNKINIVSNPIKNEVGSYVVKYDVKDNAGNTATFEQTFEVITTDAPEFWVSKDLINIEDVNKLSIEQVATIIANYENIDFESYTVMENEYLGNEATSGTYNIRLQFTDRQGNISEHARVMSVFSGDDLNTEVDGFWYKIKNLFKNIWNAIKTFFKWVWKVVSVPFKFVGKLFGFGKTNSVVFLRNRF